MYESPINQILGEMQITYENECMKAVQSCGFDVNKEELLKSLMYDREQYSKGYSDGYADAIDKFREVVGINIIDIFVSDSDYKMADGILKTIAEQLKGEK